MICIVERTKCRLAQSDAALCSKTVKRLPELNGTLGTYYCGSHFGHGLHEDGVTSAIGVAEALGVDVWG